MLKKIISGGQTGADLGALRGANKCLIETGGCAPKGYKTEDGPNLKLRDLFGLTESKSYEYPPRTKKNVRDADATLWVGNINTLGGRLTLNICAKHDKPFKVVPYYWNTHDQDKKPIAFAQDVLDWLKEHDVEVLNVAGNRQSKNPGVGWFTEQLIRLVDAEMKHPGILSNKREQSAKSQRRKNRMKEKQQAQRRKRRKRLRRRIPDNAVFKA